VLLDPQGFLRRTDSEKRIILEKTDIDLSKISAIKTSPDELFCLTNNIEIEAMKNLQKRGVEHVIVTNKREITMLVKDKLYSITLPNLELYDTTGIGDIFCSTFCCTMLKEKDFFWALCFAGGAAQAAIESKEIGLEKIPAKGAIETNASYFYNQIKFKQV
jgi:sugar/nucleoside kinase (ribokinase family)